MYKYNFQIDSLNQHLNSSVVAYPPPIQYTWVQIQLQPKTFFNLFGDLDYVTVLLQLNKWNLFHSPIE